MIKQHSRLRWIPVLIGLAAAILLTAGSTAAWFYYQQQMAAVSAIRPPNSFLIRDGKWQNDPLCIPKIDLADGNPYEFFFSIIGSGDYVIQIGYTTNVPYTFKLYALNQATSSNHQLVCTDQSGTNFFDFAAPQENILTKKLNPDGTNRTAEQTSTLSTGKYATYDARDTVQINAEPLYEQTDVRNNPEDDGSVDSEPIGYYLLDICWDISNGDLAKYNEESDMIYIVAGSPKAGGNTGS